MHKEEQKKKMSWFGFPVILPYLKPYRAAVAVMILFGAFSSLIDSVFPLFNRYALDHYVGDRTLDTVGWFIGAYVVILAVQVVINYISTYLCSKAHAFCGDLVGYGPNPEECTRELMKLENLTSVMGNHDVALFNKDFSRWFSEYASKAMVFTAKNTYSIRLIPFYCQTKDSAVKACPDHFIPSARKDSA